MDFVLDKSALGILYRRLGLALLVLLHVGLLTRDAGGGSIGKRLMGLRVIGEDGRRCSVLQSIARNLSMAVIGAGPVYYALTRIAWLFTQTDASSSSGDRRARTRVSL